MVALLGSRRLRRTVRDENWLEQTNAEYASRNRPHHLRYGPSAAVRTPSVYPQILPTRLFFARQVARQRLEFIEAGSANSSQ